MHMTRCQHPGRKKMLRLTISSLLIWMNNTRVDPVLVDMVEDFLLAQGKRPMMECLSVQTSEYVNLAQVCDRIGYDGLVEGRIASKWLEIVRPMLKEAGLRLSPQRWGREFVAKLLNITHKQWIFRNSKKHFRGEGGLTAAESQSMFDRIEELMHTDPDKLLPKHKHLMNEDFRALGEGAARHRQYWIANMETAIAAARHVQRGSVVNGSMPRLMRHKRRDHCTRRQSGSVIYRRQRRRPRELRHEQLKEGRRIRTSCNATCH